MSYPRHPLGVGFYPSAEKQSVYSIARGNWAKDFFNSIRENWLGLGNLFVFQNPWEFYGSHSLVATTTLFITILTPMHKNYSEESAYISSSSTSCRAASTDIPDLLAPLFPIVHGMSSGLHPVSLHSCYMYILAGRPAFARPYVGVHRSTSLMSSSLLLLQCPACLIRLTLIVFVMGGRWPYSWCFVGCCRQDFFNIARNILV